MRFICDVASLRLESSLRFMKELAPEKAIQTQGKPDVQKEGAGAKITLTFRGTSPAGPDSTMKELTQCVQTKLQAAFKAEKSALKGSAVETMSGCDRVNHSIEMKNGDVLYGELCGLSFSVLGDFLEASVAIKTIAYETASQTAEILLTVEIETQDYKGRCASGSAKPGDRPALIDGRAIAAIR